MQMHSTLLIWFDWIETRKVLTLFEEEKQAGKYISFSGTLDKFYASVAWAVPDAKKLIHYDIC